MILKPELSRLTAPVRDVLAITAALGVFASCTQSIEEPDELPANPSAASLAVRTQPSGAASGALLTVQPAIEVLDAEGDLLTGDNETVVTAALATGTGTLGGTLDRRAASGVATFTDLVVTGVVGQWTLEFVAAGLPAVMSNPFTVAPGAASPAMSVVTVSSGTVAVEDAVELQLQAADADGNAHQSGGLTVAFTASGGTSEGTIDPVVDQGDGTYGATFTATVAGTAITIGATIDGEAVTSTLPTITVTESSPPPPTSCSGVVVHPFPMEEHFDGSADLCWYDAAGFDFDLSVSAAGSGSARATWQTGDQRSSSGAGRLKHDPTNEIYFSYYVLYESAWQGSGTGSHPHEFHFLSTEDTDYSGLAGGLTDVYVETHLQSYGLEPWVGPNTMGRPMLGEGSGNAYAHDGEWHFHEVYMKMNDVGESNGVVKKWVDGEVYIDRSDIVIRESDIQFQYLIFPPWMGSSPITQTAWYDEFYVDNKMPSSP